MTADEIAHLRKRIADLEIALAECANDLAGEVDARYEKIKDHPAMGTRYKRDMASVYAARALLFPKPKEAK